jgi:hypothetical protein
MAIKAILTFITWLSIMIYSITVGNTSTVEDLIMSICVFILCVITGIAISDGAC